MNKALAIVSLICCFLVIIIWFFILYEILSLLPVDRLVWVAYWVYVPAQVIVSTIMKVFKDE